MEVFYLANKSENIYFTILGDCTTESKEIDEKDIVISDYDVLASEDKINLYKKIQQLDTETRDVIYLRLSGELTFKEISEIMNKTESWVRVTFYRGKEKLKLKENIENERKQRL